MVVSDVNILCIRQRELQIPLLNELSVLCNSDDDNQATPVYSDSWNVVQSIKGIWYTVEPRESELMDYQYDHELFDLCCINAGGITQLQALPEPNTVERIMPLIRFYIKQSPVNAVCLLLRLQETPEPEVIKGVIEIDEFESILIQGMALFNCAYIITG